MSKKARILVVDSDLHALSKIYLGLIHKNYRVEASADANEIIPRVERFKPRLIILRTSTQNLTSDIYEEIAKKRLLVFLINDSGLEIPVELKKSEPVEMPVNINWLDEKIREVLGIVEL
jgi:DNA-binding response OmpR family regulator